MFKEEMRRQIQAQVRESGLFAECADAAGEVLGWDEDSRLANFSNCLRFDGRRHFPALILPVVNFVTACDRTSSLLQMAALRGQEQREESPSLDRIHWNGRPSRG